MILNEEKQNVQVTGLTEQKKFQIKASAKAFKILSSTMYSDPIKAIIRELSCNAYDSHVAAGTTDVPFTVKLPNSVDRSFYVEDYGLGLSKEDVLNLYSTYFESTKTESNDYTGALGLGSKTPFSYTDSFIVISRFNGEEMTFTAFIDETGGPSIALVSTVPTTERNGLRVEIAVKQYDFYEFSNKAQTVLRPFIHRPTVKGAANFEIADYEGENLFGEVTSKTSRFDFKWQVYSEEARRYYRQHGNLIIVQGNIEYKASTRNDEKHRPWFRDCTLVVETPIGFFDFSASREELHYTEQTHTDISEILDAVEDVFKSHLQEAVDKITSQYEWTKNQDLYTRARMYKDIVWNGKELTKNDVYLLPHNDLIVDVRHNYDSYNNGISSINYDYVKDPTTGKEVRKAFFLYPEAYHDEHDLENIVVVDKSHLAVAKFKELPNMRSSAMLRVSGKTEEERATNGKKILKEFGYPDDRILLASDLAKPEKIAKSRIRTNFMVHKIGHGQGYENTYGEEIIRGDMAKPVHEVITDDTRTVIYVPYYRAHPIVEKLNADGVYEADYDDPKNRTLVNEIKNMCSITRGEDVYIVGVPLQFLKKVPSDWITVEKALKKYTKKHVKSEAYKQFLKYSHYFGKYDKSHMFNRPAFDNLDSHDFIKEVVKVSAGIEYDTKQKFHAVAKHFGHTVEVHEEHSEDKICERYPMLAFVLRVGYYGYEDHKEKIGEYIDLINSQK